MDEPTYCRNHRYECDNKVEEEGELCAPCADEHARQVARNEPRYRAQRHYTHEEILDAYSHPTEFHKLTSLLRDFQ